MRLKYYLIIVLLCFLFTACGVSYVYSIRTKPKPVKILVLESVQIIDIGMQPHKEYVVIEIIDLKGKQVNVPEDVTITFKMGGAIVNGTLNGKGTKLNSKTDEVLGIKLKGTWRVDKISDLVFDKQYLTDTDIINNLNVIQSDTMTNEVTINRDYHVAIAKSGGAGLIPSNHSTILLKGTISLESNDYKKYQIIDIKNKEDVTINGGCIVGDVGQHTYIEGTTSEWGMGISITQSKDVSISDMYITKCTGDGIYISGGKETSIGIYDNANKNITISNVTCDDNRRQGLSVGHVDGLIVSDCCFVNTGQTEYTPPGAGIDIEPNVSSSSNMSVRNVVVDNCYVANNKIAISSSSTREAEGKFSHENILFSNCKTDGLLKAQTNDLTFRKSSFKEIRFASVYCPTHITIEECTISGGYGIKIYAPSSEVDNPKDRMLTLLFKNCTISMAEDNMETKALFNCYKYDIPNIKEITIENCRLIIPQSVYGNISMTDYSFNNKMRIVSSIIDMTGREFDDTGLMLQNNVIICSKASEIHDENNNIVIITNDNVR